MMRTSLTHHPVREEVEAEAVNMGKRQVREQMFSEKMMYSRRSSSSKVEHYLCFFSDKHHLQLFVFVQYLDQAFNLDV